MPKPIRSAGYRSATHTGYSAQAQHNSVAQLVSLEIMDGTYESIYLVAFILAGPVYYNALTNCATRVCCACVDLITCVAVQYLPLRTGCERHGRKNPLPFPCSKRSHIGNLRRIRKQGKGRSSKRKGNRRCPFLFAPAAGAALSRAPQSATPRLISSEKPPAR